MTPSSKKLEKTNQIIADRFRLQRLVAAKNSVETWEALETENGRPILLKLLPSQVYVRRRYWSRMQQVLARTREWRHAGAISFHHIGQTTDPFFFIGSRYLQGKTLKEFCENSSQSDNSQSLPLYLSILRQVASTLDSAHAHQIGHFSLKPGNIFIDTDGTIRITDFLVPSEIRLALLGQMRFLNFSNEDYYYLAPEQLNGQVPTKASDLFSFASLAYHLLTGMRPDYTAWKEFLSQNPFNPVLMKTVHKEIDAVQCEKVTLILSRGLSAAPENRFTSCRKFIDDILDCLGKRNSLLSSFLVKDTTEVPVQDTDVTKIVISTNSQTDSPERERRNHPVRNWKSFAWLINLFLLICICFVAYGKRELLMGLISSNKTQGVEKSLQNPEPAVTPAPVKEMRPSSPQAIPPGRPLEPIHYDSLHQPNRQQPSEPEIVATIPEMNPIAETPEPTALPTVPQTLIDRIQSDARVVYESGFTATSWDIQESMIAALAAQQVTTWQEGVEHDIPEACYLMAWCHRQGYENVRKRNNTAFELFLKAAEKGFPPAQFDLAYHCYLNGVGTAKNKTLANEWLERAARNNETRALYFKAVELLDLGQVAEAVDILQKLSQKGFVPAKKRLETIRTK